MTTETVDPSIFNVFSLLIDSDEPDYSELSLTPQYANSISIAVSRYLRSPNAEAKFLNILRFIEYHQQYMYTDNIIQQCCAPDRKGVITNTEKVLNSPLVCANCGYVNHILYQTDIVNWIKNDRLEFLCTYAGMIYDLFPSIVFDVCFMMQTLCRRLDCLVMIDSAFDDRRPSNCTGTEYIYGIHMRIMFAKMVIRIALLPPQDLLAPNDQTNYQWFGDYARENCRVNTIDDLQQLAISCGFTMDDYASIEKWLGAYCRVPYITDTLTASLR